MAHLPLNNQNQSCLVTLESRPTGEEPFLAGSVVWCRPISLSRYSISRNEKSEDSTDAFHIRPGNVDVEIVGVP